MPTSFQLAGSKAFGGLNRRLKEKTAESRWFETTGQAPFGRAKAAYWKINDWRASTCLFSVRCDRAARSPGDTTSHVHEDCRGTLTRQPITASIHSEDPALVLAPAPTADISAPVPAPGHCAVSGIGALPHPSFARTGRVGRCLAFCPPQNMAGVHTEEAPLKAGPLQEGRLQEAPLEEG